MLKTTSPTCVARAPNDRPRHTLPSSSTSLQSVSSQGLLTAAAARVTVRIRVVVVVRRVGVFDAWRRVAAAHVVVCIVVVALIFRYVVVRRRLKTRMDGWMDGVSLTAGARAPRLRRGTEGGRGYMDGHLRGIVFSI